MIKIETPGFMKYIDALNLQKKEKDLVLSGDSEGGIFILQHDPPVITIGRRGDRSSFAFPEEDILNQGFSIEQINRAGDVTVHEPGQVVVYFILPVKSKDVKSFIDSIMVPLSQYLSERYSVCMVFRDDMPGLWISGRKVCSMGFDLTGGVSMHGIAINVDNSLKGFDLVVPCGLEDVKMTSLSLETGKVIDVEDFILELKNYFIDQHHL